MTPHTDPPPPQPISRTGRPGGRPGRRLLAALGGVLALAATVTLAGCSSGSGSGGDSGGSSASLAQRQPAAAAGAPGAAAAAEAAGSAQGGVADIAKDVSAVQQASVISTGSVGLRSRDVGRALSAVRRVVGEHGGSVQKQSTDTDQHGDPVSSSLTVRVPSGDFDQAMTDLGRAATLTSTSSRTRDVTTSVLDNRVRVQVAKRSINRISALLDQATTIRDVIAIEGQLSQRQADLASLEQQERYLADQTSMATITVTIDSTGAPAATQEHRGFAAGLAAGWHALARTAGATATAAGALLPWAVVVAVVGVPVWLLRRRRTADSPGGTA